MRILLDESLPIELRDELSGHSVSSVQEMGWSSLKNGELLLRAAAQFDVFLTADQNLQFQQNLRTLPVAVAVLAAAGLPKR
jgi:predicted nuclease of predicted toxin-antitoxin system